MKKKVGLLLPSLNSGGAERAATRISFILNDIYDIYVILFEDTYKKYSYAGKLINMDIKAQPNKLKQLILPLRRANALKKIKKQYELDAVISFMDSPNLSNLLSKVKRCKTICSIRNYDYKENGILFDIASKLFLKKSNAVVPVSRVIAKVIQERYNVREDRINVIYNPYDLEQIQTKMKESIQEKYANFFNNLFCFISVGRNVPQKGFWHLVKAFSLVLKSNPNAGLVIVGRDEFGGKLEQLIRDLGIGENVLLTGYSENPFKMISRSKVYVLSSLYEGFPNSLAEAMACGCPVISADCKSGPREILYKSPDIDKVCREIEEADYGILVKPMEDTVNWDADIITESEKILAKAMMRMMSDSNLLNHYKICALERIKYFNYDMCKGNYVKVIER